jgi:6-phosphogluconolactonase
MESSRARLRRKVIRDEERSHGRDAGYAHTRFRSRVRPASIFMALLALTSTISQGVAAEHLVYFGTYTGPKSKGIYVSRFETSTGKLTAPELAAELARPSWVTTHPNGKFLYAVSELGNDSTITAYSIDRSSGKLKELNKVPSGGSAACHLAINKPGSLIFVANYGNGTVAGFRLLQDGTLGARTAFVQHQGSSVNQRRQRGPHAHAVVLSPDGKFLFVPDLGTDQYVAYKVDAEGGITPFEAGSPKVKPGSGPRHFAFHPNGKLAYGLNEMGSSVTGFTYDGKGSLREIETVSTLPADFKEESNSAEIEVDSPGRFVYASNRGHDSIAIFAIDRSKGTLQDVQRVSTQGRVPRNFKIDPSGKFLLAANQDSDNVVVFKRDDKSGKLAATGQVLEVGSPVCIEFLPAR